MAIDVNWQFQAAIQGGPNLAVNQPPISVAAYDVVQATILPSNSQQPTTTVNVQPSTILDQVIFFALTSSVYDPSLMYQVNSSLHPSHKLVGPLLLIGGGAVELLDTTGPPQTLIIDNGLTSPVDIQILVGRNVP